MNATLSDVICYLVSQRQANFFARILTGMRIERTNSVPAMAVMLRKRNYVLLYNEKWLSKASYDQVVVVIEHEAHHLILEHIPRQLRANAMFTSKEKKVLFDTVTPFAADLADNSLLNDYSTSFKKILGEMGLCFPGTQPFEKLPRDRAYEWYLSELMREAKKDLSKLQKLIQMCLRAGMSQDNKSKEYKQGFQDGYAAGEKESQEQGDKGKGKGKGKGDGKDESQDSNSGGAQNSGSGGNNSDYSDGFNDGKQAAKEINEGSDGLGRMAYEMLSNHQLWKDESDKMNIDDKLAIADELEQQGKSIVKKAVEDQKKNRGTIPGYLQEIIDEMMLAPKISWLSILRNKVINTQRYKYVRSVRRAKRRHTGIPQLMKFPGRSKDRSFTVAMVIDTSGSMGQDELLLAISELQGLQMADRDIEIYVVQVDTQVCFETKLGARDEIKFDFYGRGGTDFNDGLIKAKELRPDICFYYTDGYAPAPDKRNRLSIPFIWIITPGGCIPDKNYGGVITTGDVDTRENNW